MVQSKKLVPEIYSQSFDFSIFTAVLDLVYTARELDILRIGNAHLPTKCFQEDVPHLSSNFGLTEKATRELLAEYRMLVKQKGSQNVIAALAQFAAGLDAQQNVAELRIITDTYYADKAYSKEPFVFRDSLIKESRIETTTETKEVHNLIDGTSVTKSETSTTQFYYELWQRATVASYKPQEVNALITEINKSKMATEERSGDYVTVSISDEDGNRTRAILADSEGNALQMSTMYKFTKTIKDGTVTAVGSHKPADEFNTTLPIVKQVSTIEVYLPFESLSTEILELLIKRLVPVNTIIVVRPLEEFESHIKSEETKKEAA
ncbi:MAG: hypothetical protein NC218_02350 [Acetobacter sp.]|nr:hypothetical protein [Acetobacter sp.]